MKNFLVKKCLLAFALLFCSHVQLNAVNGIFTGSRAVTVTQGYDFSGNTIIIASVGSIVVGVLSSPVTWSVTHLSDGISLINNSDPVIFANTAGDIVVAWTYLDDSLVPQVAASILPRGGSSWISTTISSSLTLGSNAYNDMKLSGDANGNVLLTWTAFNTLTGTNQVYGATALLSVSTDWTAPFLLF